MGHYKKEEKGGFLNCYELAYAGRDTVNQFNKAAPGLISKTWHGRKVRPSPETLETWDSWDL